MKLLGVCAVTSLLFLPQAFTKTADFLMFTFARATCCRCLVHTVGVGSYCDAMFERLACTRFTSSNGQQCLHLTRINQEFVKCVPYLAQQTLHSVAFPKLPHSEGVLGTATKLMLTQEVKHNTFVTNDKRGLHGYLEHLTVGSGHMMSRHGPQ